MSLMANRLIPNALQRIESNVYVIFLMRER